jgi:hypothetical protein
MKKIAIMAVLFATLFLLTGVAFAQVDCSLYEFTWTDLDNGKTGEWCAEICFGSGTYSGFCEESGSLVFFVDPMQDQALFYATSTSSPNPPLGYLKFHGDDRHRDYRTVFNGIEYCDGYRYKIRGHKVDGCAIHM